jgi:hypothetical protein
MIGGMCVQGTPENKKKSGECEELASRERVEGHELDVGEEFDKPHRAYDIERNI